MNEPIPERLSFDQKTQLRLKETIINCLVQAPEISSVVCITHYQGQLDDSEPLYAVWTGEGPGGELSKPEEIFGAIRQVFRFIEEQMLPRAKRTAEFYYQATVKHGQQLAEQAADIKERSDSLIHLGDEIRELQEQKAALEQEISKLKASQAPGSEQEGRDDRTSRSPY